MPSSSLRRTRRRSNPESVGPSGSEYHGSEKSSDTQADNVDQPDEAEPSYTKTKRGRTVRKTLYTEADTSEDDYIGRMIKEEDTAADQLFDEDIRTINASRTRAADDDEDDDDDQPPRQPSRRRRTEAETLGGFIVLDDDDPNSNFRFTRLRSKQEARKKAEANSIRSGPKKFKRTTRNSTRADDNYVDQPSSMGSADGDGSLEDAPQTSSDLEMEPDPDPEPEPEDDGKPYSLRQRQRINYAIPPPIEELPKSSQRQLAGRSNKGGWHGGHKKRGLGWSASGAELSRWLRIPGDDSVRPSCVCKQHIFIVGVCRTRIMAQGPLENPLVAQILRPLAVAWLLEDLCLAIWPRLAPHRIWAGLVKQVVFKSYMLEWYLCMSFSAS